MACRLTSQQLAELETLYAKGDAQGFADALRTHLDPTFTGSVLEAWKAGLLTGPSTHGANIIGNTLNLAVDVLTTGIAGGVVDPVLSRLTGKARTVRAAEMGAQIAGMRSVLGDAARRFFAESGDALLARTEALPGMPEFDEAVTKTKAQIAKGAKKTPTLALDVAGKFDNPPVGRIKGKKGVVIRTPFRLLEAADAFFKRLISTGELYRQAHKDGMAKGLQGQGLHRHMEKFVTDFYADVTQAQGMRGKMSPGSVPIFDAMQQAARRGTFQEANRDDWFGHATKHFQQIQNDIPILHFIAPFVRTPANLARKSFELTPLGALGPAWDALARGNMTQDNSERLARAMLGTLASSILLALAREGYLTGSGPTDSKERQVWEQSGAQPYAFVIPDKGKVPKDNQNTYIQFGRFEPIASMASLAADLAEAQDEDEAKGVGKKLLAGVTNAFTSKTFLQGVERLFEAWSDPQRYMEGFVKGLAGSVVPAGVGALARASDDKLRDTSRGTLLEQVGATVKSRIPGMSKDIPVRRTGLGQEVERRSGPLFRLLSPAQVTEDVQGEYADLQREMVDIGYVPRPVGATFKMPGKRGEKAASVQLTPEEEELLQEGIRKGADMGIRLMRSPGWSRRPDTEAEAADARISKEHVLKRAFDQARDEARARVRRMVSRRLRSQITVQ